jgi:cell division protein FtsB
MTYGVFGGEYGTFDWLELRRQEREERAAIARLTVEVDSLRRFAQALETDRRLQERLARENFGMIRKGEYLYRIMLDSLDATEER